MWKGEGRKGERGEGHRRKKTDGNLPPSQIHAFLPALIPLAWKRKVSARVVTVKSQSHRLVFHLEDHGSISEPPTQNCDLETRNPKYGPTSSFQGISGPFATGPSGKAGGGKKVRGFFFSSFECDGLVPSCLSPPPLPLFCPSLEPLRPVPGPAFRLRADEGLQPKRREQCVPLKASCRQWAGREAQGSPLLRPLPPPCSTTPQPAPSPGQTDKQAAGRTQSHASGASEPAPSLSLSPLCRRIRTLCRPSLPRPPPTSHSSPSLLFCANPQKKWEGVTRNACLAPALWE